ncbi:MAG: fumarylacetoacetate hydrolase family protein [Acholeplasmatales bacterium]|nr:fumarylacetoacetate hydrolase family protein [Acholeplasmatales bacterium]
MKFIHYTVDNSEHVGVLKDNVIYRTQHKNIEELFNIDISSLDLEIESGKIKELPIIEHPNQDILCLGMNYTEHKKECENAGFDNDKRVASVYFSKRCSKAITTKDVINLHYDITSFVDYEGELGIILKKDLYRPTSIEEIKDAIFGYIVVNDVSARDLQSEHKQFYFGKSLDTFTVLSSTLVTKDEFSFPIEVNLRTYVNDELRQNNNTRNMIFDTEYFLKELTKGITLKAGTIIATGTPSGIGKALNMPLKDNDIVRIEIDGVGKLENVCKE